MFFLLFRQKGIGKENAEEEGRPCRARKNKAGSRTDTAWKQKALQQYNSPLRVSSVQMIALQWCHVAKNALWEDG